MKKNYKLSLALLLLGVSASYAQQNVGIGTQMPDNSAVLDIQSVDKGLLIPRMTLDQRNLIANPANGLMIYQTNENSGFYFFNGDKWASLSDSEAKSISNDPNDWTMNGNPTATAANFLGTPAGVPINFKIGGVTAGQILSNTSLFLGYNSGLAGTGASNNSGIGFNTLSSLTTGYSNTAFGSGALQNNTVGRLNLAVGGSSLNANTTGEGNVGLGFASLYKNITGSNNIAIGADGQFNNVAGSQNVSIGRAALVNSTGSFNVAIGYQAGRQLISGGSNVFIGNQAGYSETTSNKLYISNSSSTTPLVYGDFSAKFISIGDVPVAKRNAVATAGEYGLLVKGGILTEKVKVALSTTGDWADYVFEPSYKLMSLEKVEAFTKENKHLPNVPSAEQMAEGGLDVAQTSKMFMEKIEELTLYIIDLNKEVQQLKKENVELRNSIK